MLSTYMYICCDCLHGVYAYRKIVQTENWQTHSLLSAFLSYLEGMPSLSETASPYYIPGLEPDLQVSQLLVLD